MNKKGFTLVELLGVIAVLAIVGGMVVVSMTGVIGTGKKTAYESYEKTFELSVQNYLTDYPDEEPTEDYSTKIYLKEMIAKGYIEDYKDSNGGDCNDASNNSYVLVTKPYNVSGVSNDYQLEYKTCLICKNGSGETYKSTNCSNYSDGIIYLISYNLNG